MQGVKTVHGYGISAENTFWSKEGVLHFSSLRDSLDEQTIADILACILNKEPIQRSRLALDRIYAPSTKDFSKFESLLVRALGDLQVTTQRKAIEPVKRRANINSIKGSIQDAFAEDDVRDIPLGKPLVFTFENSLRRSRIELPHYEFKQGLLSLDASRGFSAATLDDIVQAICRMANIEPARTNTYISE